MPPALTRFYVDNFRCLRDFDLRLSRRTVLLGPSGSGKSSVFDVLTGLASMLWEGDTIAEAFPAYTLTARGGTEQRVGLEALTSAGPTYYVLHVAHDAQSGSARILSEGLGVGEQPLYRFSGGKVELAGGARFDAPEERSFLATQDAEALGAPLRELKSWLHGGGGLRLQPDVMRGAAPAEESGLTRDGENFASFCRYSLQRNPAMMARAAARLRLSLPGFKDLHIQPGAALLVATFAGPAGGTYDLAFGNLSHGQKMLVALHVLVELSRGVSSLCLDGVDTYIGGRDVTRLLGWLAQVSDETGLQVLMSARSPEAAAALGADAVVLDRPDGGPTRIVAPA